MMFSGAELHGILTKNYLNVFREMAIAGNTLEIKGTLRRAELLKPKAEENMKARKGNQPGATCQKSDNLQPVDTLGEAATYAGVSRDTAPLEILRHKIAVLEAAKNINVTRKRARRTGQRKAAAESRRRFKYAETD